MHRRSIMARFAQERAQMTLKYLVKTLIRHTSLTANHPWAIQGNLKRRIVEFRACAVR